MENVFDVLMGKLLLYFYTQSVNKQMTKTVWITQVVQENTLFENDIVGYKLRR